MPRESLIQAQIIGYLRSIGAKVYNEHGDGFARKGKPDLLACLKGQFVAIEVKRPGERPTPLQERELEQIRQAGGVAFVAHSVAEARETLTDWG